MSAHNVHNIHRNSVAAHRELSGTRHQAVLDVVRALGSATDRAICVAMGAKDMNYVRPRVTELVKRGLLVELRSQRCPQTGRNVRVVALPVSGVAA